MSAGLVNLDLANWNQCGFDLQVTSKLTVPYSEYLEIEMAARSSILAWRIPWIEEPGGVQCIRSQRIRHNWAQHSTAAQWISGFVLFYFEGVCFYAWVFCYLIIYCYSIGNIYPMFLRECVSKLSFKKVHNSIWYCYIR